MEEKFIRHIVYYGDHYLTFFEKQRSEVKKKLNRTPYLIATVERLPEK